MVEKERPYHGLEAPLTEAEATVSASRGEGWQTTEDAAERKTCTEGAPKSEELCSSDHSLRTIEGLRAGDHLCCIYEGEDEHRAVLTAFLRQGLVQGEKVIYIVDAHTAGTVLGYLRDAGLDVESYLAGAQLEILSRDDAYLRGGSFDPDAMVALLRAETERALAEGYAALRVTGEMTWALRGLPGSDRLIECEAKLNGFFPGSKCLALCQYDRRRFEPAVLLSVLRTHPVAVVGTEVFDNFYYIPAPELRASDLPSATLRHWLSNLEKRRQMEQALQESEARLRLALSSAAEGMWDWSPVTGGFFLDRGGLKMLGYSRDELAQPVGLLQDLVHPDDLPRALATLQEHVEGRRQLYEAEFRLRTKSGEWRWVACVGRLVQHEDSSRPARVIGTLRDVTERKRADEALRESRAMLQELFDQAPVGYHELETEGRITRVNQTELDMLGYTAEEMVGRPVWQFIAEEEEARAAVIAKLTGVSPPGRTFERSYRRKDGALLPVFIEDRMLVDAAGQVTGIRSTIQGITERKRAEAEIRRLHERFSGLYHSSKDAIGWAAVDGSLLDVNDSFCTLTGYSKAELLAAMKYQDITPEEYREFEAAQVKNVLKTGKAVEYEKEYIRKDGSRVPILLTVFVVKDATGRPMGVAAIIKDMTARKRARQLLVDYQKQLRRLAAELAMAQERERRRFATYLHDKIGQALVVIHLKLGELAAMTDIGALGKTVTQVRDLLEETIEEAQTLTFDLSPPILHELGFAAAIEWAGERIHQETGLRVDFEDDGRPKPVYDDVAGLLFRGARELLLNVAKHARASRAQVSIRKEDDHVHVTIEDDGVGFDLSETRGRVGTTGGFGLLSIREHLAYIGGSLEIDSTPGRGTRAALVAPVRSVDSPGGGSRT